MKMLNINKSYPDKLIETKNHWLHLEGSTHTMYVLTKYKLLSVRFNFSLP